ncbi:MAG: pentapeptide repeat-containing protein, partial [Proteobacteria bacterium]|nr:pentapeptide repeat-containing protein [Pseudomonadota bacterium]
SATLSLFKESHFGSFSSFVKTTFRKRADFTETIFEDGAEFDQTRFKDIVDFSKMIGRHGGSPAHITFARTEFEAPAFFHRVNLSRARFFGVHLDWVSFLRANFEDRHGKTRFIDCEWATTRKTKANKNYKRMFNKCIIFRRPGRILFDELLLKLGNTKSLEIPESGGKYTIEDLGIDKNLVKISFVEDVALKFKASLEASRDPIPAGDFNFSVMEMKREKAKRSRKFGCLTLRHLALLFYRGLSGYGERPLRSLFWFTFSIIAFWLLYLDKTYLCWKQSLYLSWYHTLPFKLHASLIDSAKKWFVGLDPYWGVVTGIQTFIGTTLFAFLVLALRNRFKR